MQYYLVTVNMIHNFKENCLVRINKNESLKKNLEVYEDGYQDSIKLTKHVFDYLVNNKDVELTVIDSVNPENNRRSVLKYNEKCDILCKNVEENIRDSCYSLIKEKELVIFLNNSYNTPDYIIVMDASIELNITESWDTYFEQMDVKLVVMVYIKNKYYKLKQRLTPGIYDFSIKDSEIISIIDDDISNIDTDNIFYCELSNEDNTKKLLLDGKFWIDSGIYESYIKNYNYPE